MKLIPSLIIAFVTTAFSAATAQDPQGSQPPRRQHPPQTEAAAPRQNLPATRPPLTGYAQPRTNASAFTPRGNFGVSRQANPAASYNPARYRGYDRAGLPTSEDRPGSRTFPRRTIPGAGTVPSQPATDSTVARTDQPTTTDWRNRNRGDRVSSGGTRVLYPPATGDGRTRYSGGTNPPLRSGRDGGHDRDRVGTYADAWRRYHHDHHDRNWWSSHHDRIILFSGGYYYWDTGYWYPAWGYDEAYSNYAYDGPIYGGGGVPPDEIISSVQSALQEEGYYRGEIDGELGPLTRQALATWQRNHGLAVTTVIDEPTLQSLGL